MSDTADRGGVPIARSKEIGAGFLTAIFLIASSVSYAAAVFSGPLAAFLPVGIGYGLLGAAISAAIFAARSGIPFAVGGPDSKPTAVLALMAVGVAGSAASLHLPGGAEGTAAIALLVLVGAAILNGLVLYLFGRFRIGRWIRFVPFPVVGGFIAASGWLLIVSAVRILTRVDPGWRTLGEVATRVRLAQLGAGILFALALAAIERSRKGIAFPALLLGTIALAHAGRALAGISIGDAQAAGWLLKMPRQPVVPIVWLARHWQAPPAALLLRETGGAIALIVVTAFTLMLGITSIEVDTRFGDDVDVDHELRVNGIANLAAGLAGGMAGTLSLSRTLFNFQNGARGRLGGILAAGLCLATLAFGTGALGWVPVPILGGMLLRLGFDLLDDWFIQGWKRMDRADYAQVVIILFAIAIEGFIAGVALGVIAACVTFAINTSRVGLVKQGKGPQPVRQPGAAFGERNSRAGSQRARHSDHLAAGLHLFRQCQHAPAAREEDRRRAGAKGLQHGRPRFSAGSGHRHFRGQGPREDAPVRRTGGLSDRFLGSRLEGRGTVALRRPARRLRRDMPRVPGARRGARVVRGPSPRGSDRTGGRETIRRGMARARNRRPGDVRTARALPRNGFLFGRGRSLRSG